MVLQHAKRMLAHVMRLKDRLWAKNVGSAASPSLADHAPPDVQLSGRIDVSAHPEAAILRVAIERQAAE